MPELLRLHKKIEHYEIATDGTLAAFAKTLGKNYATKLLRKQTVS
ncbi:DUF892 family protein [Flavobacterium chungangensis]|uniref:DUF892 family protein n=1 Tax=Flavobacterium chungangensis TaxID=2708132 RepID=A0ABV8ZGN0_9FLAO